MTETTDWNSGQGAYPEDRDTWTLTMRDPYSDENVVRHISPSRPTLDEIHALCDDEFGEAKTPVRVQWYLEDPDGNETDGKYSLKMTGGAA